MSVHWRATSGALATDSFREPSKSIFCAWRQYNGALHRAPGGSWARTTRLHVNAGQTRDALQDLVDIYATGTVVQQVSGVEERTVD